MEHCVFKLCKVDRQYITFTLSEGRLAETLSLTSREVYGRTIQEIFPLDVLTELEPPIYAALNGQHSSVEISYIRIIEETPINKVF